MHLKNLALGAAAALGLAGLAGAAIAAVQDSHVLTIQLPDGGTAHIRYFGDTPPQVRLEPAQPLAPAAWPGPTASAFDPGFFAMDRVMAEMDRQSDLMLAQAQQMMSAAPSRDGLVRADLGRLPPGVTGYSYVSTVSSRGACTRSVEYRSTGDGRPQVISKTSGDCGPAKAPSGTTSGEASVTTSAPGQPGLRLTSAAYHPAS